MSLKARFFIAVTLALALIAGSASAAATGTIRTGVRTGPIQHKETTIGQVKKWFGEPDGSQSDSSPCGKMTVSIWIEAGLFVGHRSSDRTVIVAAVLQPTAQSSKHGSITWITAAGLEIGDSKARMRTLHPNAKKKTDDGSTETWRLQKNSKGVMHATLSDGKVAGLANQTDC